MDLMSAGGWRGKKKSKQSTFNFGQKWEFSPRIVSYSMKSKYTQAAALFSKTNRKTSNWLFMQCSKIITKKFGSVLYFTVLLHSQFKHCKNKLLRLDFWKFLFPCYFDDLKGSIPFWISQWPMCLYHEETFIWGSSQNSGKTVFIQQNTPC